MIRLPLTRLFTTLALLGSAAVAAAAEPALGVGFDKGAVLITIPPGTHIKKAFTEVALASGPGTLKAGPLPRADAKDELSEDVYHGKVQIPLCGAGLRGDVKLDVQYQACTEGAGGNCYPPTTVTLTVKASDIPVKPEPGGRPEAALAPPARPLDAAPEPATPLREPAPVPAAKAPLPAPAPARGLLLGLVVVFLAGIGASLTPCVYPMIPITLAIIGAKGGGRARGFTLSAVLVLGMAVTYTVLGVAAARSGAAFGAFAQRPAFLIPVSILFAAFALSLFGAFEIALPQGLQDRLQGGGPRKGHAGAFLMGLVLGPLAAPCVGPILGSVLVGIAQKGDVARGGLQLFVFALGMGLLFLAVGTFSAALPRSGAWLDRLKHLMGLVVLGFAAWNVRNVVPAGVNELLWTVTALAGVAVLGAFEPAVGLAASFRRGTALVLLVLASFLGLRAVEAGFGVRLLPAAPAAPAVQGPGPWGGDFEKALAQARTDHRRVLLDTYAVWCAQCKELDEKTWPDPAVAAWIRDHAVAVRVDADKDRPDLARTYAIGSFPTVILLDAEGRELRRSLGFQKPADMLAWLSR